MKPCILILCNALDDFTRRQRGITTDSPAASRKIFMLCQALRLAGVRACVLSLGRGRASWSTDYFSGELRRVEGIPVFFAPFFRLRFFSELVSLLTPLSIIFSLRQQNPKAIIFYNRRAAYIPTLMVASILGYRSILDLEDSELPERGSSYVSLSLRLMICLFDRFCKNGALLACNAMASDTSVRPVLSYYGIATNEPTTMKRQSKHISVLMCGTICFDTGAELLINTIRQLRSKSPPWVNLLRFEVTGRGSSLESLQMLAAEPGHPKVIVHGFTTDLQYRTILDHNDIGVALKRSSGPLAHTTFPSKIIEFAEAGLLILTTDISDIRYVLGEGALYLVSEEPEELIYLLESVIKNRTEACEFAKIGTQNVKRLCDQRSSGLMVRNFVFGAKKNETDSSTNGGF